MYIKGTLTTLYDVQQLWAHQWGNVASLFVVRCDAVCVVSLWELVSLAFLPPPPPRRVGKGSWGARKGATFALDLG